MQATTYVEAPEVWSRLRGSTSIFMAGGISNCPDWQVIMRDKLSYENTGASLQLINPRRADFDVLDPSAARRQIEWEHESLRRAQAILFWFPKATLCPITLFELGAWLHSDKPIAIGIEPGYKREEDIRIQVPLERPEIEIVSNLDDLTQAILRATC